MNHFAKIAAKLPEYGLDAMLINSDPGEFYAAGFHGEGVALVTPGRTWYYTDSRYIEAAQQLVKGAEVDLGLRGKSYAALVAELCAAHGIKKLGFEERYMSVASYNRWTTAVGAEFVPASALLAGLRAVKDEEELAAIKEAQRLTDAAFTEILNDIKPGVAECEIAAKLTYYMARMGAERNSFDPIVACGANGSKPHAIPSQKKIERGQFVTMDFGCVVGGYCSDMTRTVAVGEPSDEMRLVYDIVLRAQLDSIAAARAGVPGADIHAVAAKVIGDMGYGDRFGHGLGHSVGIEIHEDPGFAPRCDAPNPAGAVITVEPGIYLPGKFGVRIEDMVRLTEDGCEDLTHSPKELIVL